ncbi:MAG: hypothetical protein NWE94_01290 [Candidatus Bathyarchaeota archaeon]|nr:hypothetical protein [Candidatus Bathyarchaeota archaeon]
MNTLRKIRKNAKALSPVVASIILIAVTVAVSIAVAVWMGALSTGFMQTEQITFGTITFTTGTTGNVSVYVKNTGTSAVTISEVYLNGAAVADTAISAPDEVPFIIHPNKQELLTFTANIAAGGNYEVKVITAKGNPFAKSAIAQ